MLGDGEPDFVITDPATARSNGEMDFVRYHLTEEVSRYGDFRAFLKRELEIITELIEEERNGVVDEEDDECFSNNMLGLNRELYTPVVVSF